MAELNVGKLQMEILADGSAAISEINRVGEAAGRMAGVAADGMKDAGKDMEGAFDGVADAADAAGEAGEAAGEKTAQGAEKAGKSLKEVADTLSRAGEQATKFVTLPIVAAMTASVKGASDLAETMGKTEVVFDRLSDRVVQWSEDSVRSMGLAQGSALEYASTFGDMGKGMGLALETATDMSMNLTQLAADLSSFKNIRTDVAAQKLNAVYTGETEGLKSLGIVMTQTNLQAFALSQGITKQVSAMSQAELVALRYQYVMSVTKDAQGDFARTGDSMANQTRKLGETIKQAGEAFGSQLIPMITPVISTIQQWVQHIAELDSRTKNIIISVAAVAAAVGPLLLVGGKLLGFLATLKASLAALSINPVVLAIGAVVAAGAAIAGINRALNAANGDIDDTSGAYARMKAAVEKGAEGKITVDDSELDELDTDIPPITISAEGQAALDEAQRIVNELSGEKYKGQIAIDGDPAQAEAVLGEVAADIRAVKESVTIDGDGNAVIGDAGLVQKIRADIGRLEGLVVITEDPAARSALQSRIDALKDELKGIVGSVTIDFNGDGEDDMQHFRDQLAKLPQHAEYSATGKFVYPDSTQEAIEEYVAALGAAASATGDYESAVESLNKVADAEAQRKIAEVQRQGNEAAMEQARMLNSGIIDRDTYDAEMKRIVDDMTAEVQRIQAENEALKKSNEIFNDGSRQNDYGAYGEGILQATQGQGVSQEDTNTAMARLQNQWDSGGDMSQAQTAGMETLNGLLAQSTEQYSQLTAAVDTYNSAVSQADLQQQNAEGNYGPQIEGYRQMADAAALYSDALNSGLDKQSAWDAALSSLDDSLDPAMMDQFAAAMHDSSGELVGYADSLDAITAMQTRQAEAQQSMTDAQDNAAKAREQAQADLQTAVESIAQMSGLDANGLDTALNLAAETGTAISEADRQAIVGGQQIIADLAGALQEGSGDVASAINTAVSDVAGLQSAISSTVSSAASGAGAEASGEGQSIGSNLIEGARSGVMSRASELATAAANAVRGAVNAAKAAAEIKSPSRKMDREVGQQLTAGIGRGIVKGTPAAVQVMRRSTERLISGAAAVVRKGNYAVPAVAGPAPQAVDYDAMGSAMERAMGRVRFGFSVGERELAQATREANSQQMAVQSARVANRYGG